jgi:hypothetical protein
MALLLFVRPFSYYARLPIQLEPNAVPGLYGATAGAVRERLGARAEATRAEAKIARIGFFIV